MSQEQLTLEGIQPKSVEEVIHDALLQGMIRHRGNVAAYYDELLKGVPEGSADQPLIPLKGVAAQHFKKRRR